MKRLLLLSILINTCLIAAAQKVNPWTSHTDPSPIATHKAVSRISFPKEFRLFDLDRDMMRTELFKVVDNVISHKTIITIPGADGQFEEFEIVEASNFEPALQARFPEIRAFSGRGITDRYSSLKLSYSPEGVQGMIFRTDKPNEFIEAYSADSKVYAVFRSQRDLGQLPWNCTTPEEKMQLNLNEQVATVQLAGRSGGNLKTIRLAQSCNGEYSNYFGAFGPSQVNLVLAAYNATLTRCNGIYEKDLALHLNLIDRTTEVIYYSPSTDPYTTLSNWNNQLQTTLTNIIGESNYDIGHMFGASGGGGNAGCIGCICVNGSKGKGITSPADGIPQGDNFDIDYVAHEVGHQLGANHTFSHSNEGTGVNKEPGSGITIMGYAGITSQDMARHSIDIFHQTSIAQIQTNLNNKTCPITYSITTANSTPTIATLTNRTIPISTPFALTGVASDANGDPLTYCWEQNDNASSTQTGSSSVASATKATGPNWITFLPSSSPTRLFPRLSTILAGQTVTGPLTGGDAGANCEALSSVSRTLNFRLTVRDNAPYSSTSPFEVGQTEFRDVVITVTNTSGPFVVTAPNTAVTWAGGSTQNITWNVANTTATPVSCANVKITLSTDGGNTFPFVLSENTPNDGTEAVVLPTVVTSTARVKVEAVGNIFFDISNANFTISAAACASPSGLTTESITETAATLKWNAVGSATSYSLDYKLATATTWTTLSSAYTSTSFNLTGLTSGTNYDWRVRANCSGGSSSYVSAQFTTAVPFVCNAPSGLSAGSITTSSATISWSAVNGASNYTVDYKAASDTNWIVVASATASTSAQLTGLNTSTLYDFRVMTNCNDGSSSAFASAQFTTADPFVCNAPGNLNATSITTTSATLSWSAVSGASNYTVEYKISTDTNWIVAASSTASTSVQLSGLTQSTNYDFRVMTNCNDGSSSSFASSQFSTPAFVCNAPAGLNATSVTTTSATISWSAVAGASNYTVEYKTSSATTWIEAAAATTQTSTQLTGLTASTEYNFRVRTNCTDGSSSAFASSQFTTLSACASAFEPNESISAAAALTSGVAVTAAISTTTDNDYFRITTTATSNISYNLVGPSGVDFDMTIFNSAGTQIGSGTSTSATETVSLTNQAAGTYYIRIFGYNGAFSNTCYSLTATATTVLSCRSTLDNSTNGTISGAATIPFNTDVRGLIEVSNDQDNYKFVITTGGTITLTLTTLPANYHLRLVNSANSVLRTSSASGTTNETISYTAAAGTYYARVYPGSSSQWNANSCYTLRVNLGTATRSEEEINLGNPSVKVFPNPATEFLNLDLSGFENASSIEVLNMQGSRMLVRKANAGNMKLDISALPSGTYMLRVVEGGTSRRVKFVKL